MHFKSATVNRLGKVNNLNCIVSKVVTILIEILNFPFFPNITEPLWWFSEHAVYVLHSSSFSCNLFESSRYTFIPLSRWSSLCFFPLSFFLQKVFLPFFPHVNFAFAQCFFPTNNLVHWFSSSLINWLVLCSVHDNADLEFVHLKIIHFSRYCFAYMWGRMHMLPVGQVSRLSLLVGQDSEPYVAPWSGLILTRCCSSGLKALLCLLARSHTTQALLLGPVS